MGSGHEHDADHPTPAAANSFQQVAVETVGDYLVPLDPMDDLGCDSCQ